MSIPESEMRKINLKFHSLSINKRYLILATFNLLDERHDMLQTAQFRQGILRAWDRGLLPAVEIMIDSFKS
jgi:hypothetical protein